MFFASRLKLFVATSFLAACALEDPCASGMLSGTRCKVQDASELEPTDDADEMDAADDRDEPDGLVPPDEGGPDGKLDSSAPDSSAKGDGAVDAGRDAGLMDVGADGPSGEAALSDISLDSSPDAPDAVADADAESEAEASIPACPESARDAWRTFEMTEAMVPAIGACYAANPHCFTEPCNIAPCLQSSAQVVGCDSCIAAEVACATTHCAAECSSAMDDEACRACACANHCLDAPAGCGMGSVNACADCSGASCSARRALATQTITVPIFFRLLHDHIDPATGIPAYARSATENETILDIDARLAEVNAALESARVDDRRLQLIRAGVIYAAAPASGACPDPVAESDTWRLYGALNVVLSPESPDCAAAATTAFAARASGATLVRTLGNLLGIATEEQQGAPWQITADQLVRMHNYARWRLGAVDSVPEAEKQASTAFLHGPAAPIWDKLTNRDWALANASVFAATVAGPFSSHARADFKVPATRAARRVLGVRASAKFRGTPSAELKLAVTQPYRAVSRPEGPTVGTGWIPRSAIWVGDGELVAEDAYDLRPDAWDWLRRNRAAGAWTVSIEDTADVTFSDIRLELVLGDRIYLDFDRHGRGVGDLMVYQSSSSEVLTATNPANGGTAFGATARDRVPALPKADVKLSVGDVDGDGTVDLLARDGPAIWVSYFKTNFGPWRPGSIAGSDRPSESDETLLADLDADGFGDLMRRRSDAVTSLSDWAYHRGFGDGTFEPARALAVGPHTSELNWTPSINFKGRSDLFYFDRRRPMLWVQDNFTPWPKGSDLTPFFAGGWAPTINGTRQLLSTDRFLLLDTNVDGTEDLVTYRPSTREWGVYRNAGTNAVYLEWRPLTIGGSATAFDQDTVIFGTMP